MLLGSMNNLIHAFQVFSVDKHQYIQYIPQFFNCCLSTGLDFPTQEYIMPYIMQQGCIITLLLQVLFITFAFQLKSPGYLVLAWYRLQTNQCSYSASHTVMGRMKTVHSCRWNYLCIGRLKSYPPLQVDQVESVVCWRLRRRMAQQQSGGLQLPIW